MEWICKSSYVNSHDHLAPSITARHEQFSSHELIKHSIVSKIAFLQKRKGVYICNFIKINNNNCLKQEKSKIYVWYTA